MCKKKISPAFIAHGIASIFSIYPVLSFLYFFLLLIANVFIKLYFFNVLKNFRIY